jgi:crossover junction endodeoxyribonuclease RusA
MTAPINQTIIDLPFPPSTNGLFANVAGKGRIRSDRYRQWANAAGWELKSQKPKKVSGPVSIAIYVEEKRDRKRDIDNLAKGPLDLLVSHRIIDGDDIKTIRRVSLEWSKSVSGCRVAIAPAEAA